MSDSEIDRIERDWDKYEQDEQVRMLRSFHAVKASGGDSLATAAESAAHWNRMYRELLADTSARVGPQKLLPEVQFQDFLNREDSGDAEQLRRAFEAGRRSAAASSHSQLANDSARIEEDNELLHDENIRLRAELGDLYGRMLRGELIDAPPKETVQ